MAGGKYSWRKLPRSFVKKKQLFQKVPTHSLRSTCQSTCPLPQRTCSCGEPSTRFPPRGLVEPAGVPDHSELPLLIRTNLSETQRPSIHVLKTHMTRVEHDSVTVIFVCLIKQKLLIIPPHACFWIPQTSLTRPGDARTNTNTTKIIVLARHTYHASTSVP